MCSASRGGNKTVGVAGGKERPLRAGEAEAGKVWQRKTATRLCDASVWGGRFVVELARRAGGQQSLGVSPQRPHAAASRAHTRSALRAGSARLPAHHLPRSSSSCATTPGSARVEVSPSWSSSLLAILRSTRRMIFPERVLGRPGAQWMTSGVAMGPMALRTWGGQGRGGGEKQASQLPVVVAQDAALRGRTAAPHAGQPACEPPGCCKQAQQAVPRAVRRGVHLRHQLLADALIWRVVVALHQRHKRVDGLALDGVVWRRGGGVGQGGK